nr:hypothetical protein [Tanacetum cinerariifolium]
CIVNVEVFRIILDICPRVEGLDFTDVLDDDTALTFLIDLGYNGSLNKHTNMFVDHMHQPWRTLADIINKCLSGKLASKDKLKKSRIDILWGCSTEKIGKGSQGKNTTKTLFEEFKVSEESGPEPAKKRTSSKRRMINGDADDEGDDHVSDTRDAADEDDETELDEDEIYKYKIRVRNDEDEEMESAEVKESDKGDEEVTDAANINNH